MSLKVNNNIAALSSQRYLTENDRKLAQSLERLASGFKINRAADSPAGLVVSEQLRGQIAGIDQAIANSESATAMVQTTEASLSEVNNLLVRVRQLALHASNVGANDQSALEADQLEISNAIDAISRISRESQFGRRNLLDGSTGVTGGASGAGLSFVSASQYTRTSPIQGYQVEIEQVASRAYMEGGTEITESNLPGMTLTLEEGGRTAQVQSSEGDTPNSLVGKLKREAERAGLNLDITLTPAGTLYVQHREYGSAPTFRAGSNVAGVLSESGSGLEVATLGADVQGRLGGEIARGMGQLLIGQSGSENTDGLQVRYIGALVAVGEEGPDGRPIFERQPQPGIAGTINVANNALTFQTGPNAGQSTLVALPLSSPNFLGRKVTNASGFSSLADVDVRTTAGAADTLKITDAAVDELTLARGRLGAFQRNNLEKNIATLRVTAENLMAAESTIRDADVAEELTTYTKNRILFDASAAMLAQANTIPGKVLELIR
ncbi:MAG: flagellin [Candidatus Lambdaproteobacteria bacterium]|nr:flagellin [Candidatus Lambdaproteobacteria bacterium]